MFNSKSVHALKWTSGISFEWIIALSLQQNNLRVFEQHKLPATSNPLDLRSLIPMSLFCLRGWYGWSSQPLPVLNSSALSVTVAVVVVVNVVNVVNSSSKKTQQRRFWKDSLEGWSEERKKRSWLITIMNSFLNERPFGKSNRHRCCCCLIHYNWLPLLSEWERCLLYCSRFLCWR